ncbi:matrix metalloproteinase-21-like [Gigantopelta aegis]|uniref:matrix metalloproteinase-21-like n=1 Tax=Gigantopelta aegis TaxID=1735272 RepID=UPI001B88CB6A|nr:matrix metalloproteinase-21-like [Gigantopelta aegis]
MAVITMNKLRLKFLCGLHVLTLCTLVMGEPFYQFRDHRDQLKYMRKTDKKNVVKSQDDAEVVLEKYGYLRCSVLRRKRESGSHGRSFSFSDLFNMKTQNMFKEGGFVGVCNEHEIKQALQEYQRTYNLPATGELDEKTKQLMSSSRCGNKDNEAEVVNPKAVVEVVDGTKKQPGEDSGHQSKRDLLQESNKSNIPPTQRLSKRSAPSNTMLNVLVGKPPSSSLVRRKRYIQEYIERLGVSDPSKLFQPVTEEERKQKSVIVKRNVHEEPGRHGQMPEDGEEHLPLWQGRDENGEMFTKDVIKWRLLRSGYSTKIPVEDQRATLDLAFRMWSEVIPPRFVEDTDGDIRDIDIEIAFGKGAHQNCQQDFDGNGGEIAHSWHAGNMHFDDDENFKSIRSDNQDGLYLLRVAVHEIGHVLGLAHKSRSYSIMYAYYHGLEMSHHDEIELGWEDRKAIQNIYGVCKGVFSTVFDWVRKRPDNSFIYNTYFFRGNHYWMYENHANRTRYGDPLYIAREWENVPDSVDGYLHMFYFTGTAMVDDAFFFKDDNVYKYDSINDRVVDGYPQKIAVKYRPKSGQNESIPDSIDSVFFDMRDKNIYFFKNEYVYVYDPKEPEDTRGCCVRKRLVTEEYPALEGETPLPANLDAVYYSYKDKAMFFIKGEEYWINSLYHPKQKVIQNAIEYKGKWYEKWFDICDVTKMK